MAAHEEQDERVVLLRIGELVRRLDLRRLHHDGGLAPAPRDFGPEMVRHAAGGDVNQPAARVIRNAFPRPLQGRRDECFLNRVFGRREVPESSHHGPEHLRRQLAQQVLGEVV